MALRHLCGTQAGRVPEILSLFKTATYMLRSHMLGTVKQSDVINPDKSPKARLQFRRSTSAKCDNHMISLETLTVKIIDIGTVPAVFARLFGSHRLHKGGDPTGRLLRCGTNRHDRGKPDANDSPGHNLNH